jgi:hypothetical protein
MNIAEAFRLVIQNPPVYYLLALLGVVRLAATPFTVLMPAFADRILHGSPRAQGWLMGAPAPDPGAGLGAEALQIERGAKADSRG